MIFTQPHEECFPTYAGLLRFARVLSLVSAGLGLTESTRRPSRVQTRFPRTINAPPSHGPPSPPYHSISALCLRRRASHRAMSPAQRTDEQRATPSPPGPKGTSASSSARESLAYAPYYFNRTVSCLGAKSPTSADGQGLLAPVVRSKRTPIACTECRRRQVKVSPGRYIRRVARDG